MTVCILGGRTCYLQSASLWGRRCSGLRGKNYNNYSVESAGALKCKHKRINKADWFACARIPTLGPRRGPSREPTSPMWHSSSVGPCWCERSVLIHGARGSLLFRCCGGVMVCKHSIMTTVLHRGWWSNANWLFSRSASTLKWSGNLFKSLHINDFFWSGTSLIPS